ncbi:MAG: hypothetical protein H7Y38_20435, partial [Armatimonadetes bacterium]|nr:hypothetical protein [Armatimonadota bacterium]
MHDLPCSQSFRKHDCFPKPSYHERWDLIQSFTVTTPLLFSGAITGVSRAELDLAASLSSGQVFRWRFDAEAGAWRGVIENGYALTISQGDADTLTYELTGAATDADARNAVRHFLRLDDFRLADAAEAWASADPHFAEAWVSQPGVRVLRQDPHECFFSFLCASVAPITRIGGMLQAVSRECAGDAWGAFPSASCLAETSEETFRALGLGFRARRVAEAARRVADLPPGFLASLRTVS